MILTEEIRKFLPTYLSPDEKGNLYKLLSDFPSNIDSRFYTEYLKNEVNLFQGDGISKLPIISFPDENIFQTNCLIISNTCDVDIDNNRVNPINITYAPIIELDKYNEEILQTIHNSNKILPHIQSIKKQEITNILYLPNKNGFKESIVLLDRINNASIDILKKTEIKKRKLFTLSNYGFYILLLKLSMSFSRIAERVDRK